MPEFVKHDEGKTEYHMLDMDFISEISQVLMYGAKKYSPDNWKNCKDKKNRYFNAALRHLFSWFKGEKHDYESGYHHLAHCACCLMFAYWGDKNDKPTV